MTKRTKDFPEDAPRRGVFRDPAAPNPYNLPDDDMHPKKMPKREDVESRGGNYLQAEHTATLPNVLMQSWPPRLIDELYSYCWENHHGRGDLDGLINQLEDGEIDRLVTQLRDFSGGGGQFQHVGARIYAGLQYEAKRRGGENVTMYPAVGEGPMRQVKVDVRPIDDERVVHQLPASTDPDKRYS